MSIAGGPEWLYQLSNKVRDGNSDFHNFLEISGGDLVFTSEV